MTIRRPSTINCSGISIFSLVLLSLAGSALGLQPGTTGDDEGGNSQKPAIGIPDDPRLDPQTGALRAVWPPATLWDHLHMKLTMDFADIAVPRFTAVQELRLTPRGQARDVIELDCGDWITIASVTLATDKGDSPPLSTARDGRTLRISLPAPVAPGAQVTIKTSYACDFSAGSGDGLTWIKPIAGAKSETDRFPVIYSQGQAEHNHKWFPCHDFPNERVTTEMVVTVPSGYEVSSNGRQISKTVSGVGDTRRVTAHWLQDKPHVYYLVTLVIGKYSLVNIGRPGEVINLNKPREIGKPFPIMAYAPIGKEAATERVLARTPKMVRLFERLFDEPYPWDRYAQVLVRGFNGGMENTSATTLMASIADADDMDDLVSHELGHQWFGDLVTCRGWAHLWLNEGWASYCEALWSEERAGPDPKAADTEYLKTVAGFLSRQRANRGSAPITSPMVSNRYRNPDAPFQKPDNPYSKGGLILHMLREKLGKEAFYKGVALFIDRHKYALADTDDFRRSLEESSGQGLEQFFAQWCFRPGTPRFKVSLAYSAGELSITAEQTQTINGDNPAFVFDLPIVLKLPSGERTTAIMPVRGTVSTITIATEKPESILYDPRITCGASFSVEKDLE